MTYADPRDTLGNEDSYSSRQAHVLLPPKDQSLPLIEKNTQPLFVIITTTPSVLQELPTGNGLGELPRDCGVRFTPGTATSRILQDFHVEVR